MHDFFCRRLASIFYARQDKMLALLTLGFLAFGVALVVFTIYTEFLRKRSEGFLNVHSEKLLADARLVPMTLSEAENNWGEMTSERCYRTDLGESLKKTRNYLQRTNNYAHAHPDSCSAPNHEFVGTFYTPFDGVGRYPATGLPYPPSTAACNL